MRRRWTRHLSAGLAALAVLCAFLSLSFGTADIPPTLLWRHALDGSGDPVIRAILFELRLPRALLGLLVGAILGLSGAALQGYLRNPLAEPGVLGASNAAALGAVTALYFGFASLSAFAVPVLAVAAALLALGLLFLLSGRGESPLTLILAGIAIATAASAGISLALNLSSNPFAALEIMTWLLGSLEDRSFGDLFMALPPIVAGMALLLWNGRALDGLTLGEDGAKALGVDLKRLRLRILTGTALGVGGAVAVSGAIGFVGLIVPHLVRPLTDKSPSAALLPSAFAGACLLTLADLFVRLLPTTNELKLGVVTAFLGVPVFLVYLLRARRVW